MSLLSLCCRAVVALLSGCFYAVFTLFWSCCRTVSWNCCHSVIALLSRCYRAFVILLFLSCCRVVVTLLSPGYCAVVALLLRSCPLLRCCAVVSLLSRCYHAVFLLFLHCYRALARFYFILFFFHLILAQPFVFLIFLYASVLWHRL